MPADEDNYPKESGRRRFVKGVVGSSALGAVGIAGAAGIDLSTTSTGHGGGTVQYFGIKNTDGPAPRSMPQIPIKITDDGYLKGVWPEVDTKTVRGQEVKVAKQEIGGITYSSAWYQYCGIQTYAGIAPGVDQSNFFRSASSGYDWQSDLETGEKLHISDFANYETWGNGIGKAGIGKPAFATWRSKGLPPSETIPVQVLRSTKIEQLAKEGVPPDPEYPKWIQESTEKGFIAWVNKCTHFCCVPGFKSTGQSVRFGAGNDVYCPCHQSIYDPFSPVREQFTALPRPEDLGTNVGGGSSSE